MCGLSFLQNALRLSIKILFGFSQKVGWLVGGLIIRPHKHSKTKFFAKLKRASLSPISTLEGSSEQEVGARASPSGKGA